MDLTYFSARSQKESDFLSSFVARTSTFDYFLRQLQFVQTGESPKHQLLIAPRGFGKTSMLRRIAIAVRADVELKSRFVPLSFREEQHNVISLDAFWRNCLQSLLEAREDEQASEAEIAAIDAAWTRLSPRQYLSRDEQDGAPAEHELMERCQQLGRRPILLIDNLDTLLAGLSVRHQWSLRASLQEPDSPLMFAAASRYPESSHDSSAAFYEFFRIVTLDKLSDAEVLRCLRSLAENRGQAGRAVLELLDRDPGRVIALNTLAGGNPRTLSVLYSVLESHMSPDVLSQLSAMLDTFTGWYQARTDELPMQTRAVFDALALNWDPMTAAALGEATGLETTIVSSQISRLEKLGYAEAVALTSTGKGRSGYQVAERFYNIWYLMRNGPRQVGQRVKFLTVFLRLCFSENERMSLGKMTLRAEVSDSSYALALATSIEEPGTRHLLLEKARLHASMHESVEEYSALIREIGERKIFVIEETLLDSKSLDADAIAVDDGTTSEGFGGRLANAQAMMSSASSLGTLGRSEEAVGVYDALVTRFGTAPELALRELVAKALVGLGYHHAHAGDLVSAESHFRRAIRTPQASASPANDLGNFLLDFKGEAPEAASVFQGAIELHPDGELLSMLHTNAAFALALHAGDLQAARAHLESAERARRSPLSKAGRALLSALTVVLSNEDMNWSAYFSRINEAVTSDDGSLWAEHFTDLQRMLSFAIVRGQGDRLRKWMETENYSLKEAPLYHAVVAAIDGQDHLLKINPETRAPAARIHAGIARLLKLYSR